MIKRFAVYTIKINILYIMICCAIVKKTGNKCCNPAKNINFCGIHNKKNNVEKFGQNVKSRAGSTRNGFNVTAANIYSELVTDEQIMKRNNILEINNKICMYCKKNAKTDDDHLIPTCNTSKSIYGQNNSLNKVPSCSTCNSKKSAKVDEELKLWLNDYCKWSKIKIDILFNWIKDNKKYLYLDEKICNYLNVNHQHINKIHEIFQSSCEKKEDIMSNLIDYLLQNYLQEITLKIEGLQE